MKRFSRRAMFLIQAKRMTVISVLIRGPRAATFSRGS